MSLARVDFSDFPAIISTIERDGGVILTNFTTPETLTNVNAETLPWLNADKPWQGALFPPETRRCTRLIGRSPTVRTAWFEDDQLYRIISHFLAKTTWNFFDGERHVNTTYPVLSTALTMDVRPGAKGQRLHRDDKNHHVAHRDMMATGYLAESDVEMAVLVPGVEVDRENGATAVIPGSHLWGDERAPRIEEAVYASMHPGEALLFLGSTYHAGGTNSTADRTRPMHGLFYCRGTLRGEENQWLAYPTEEVKTWSKKSQVRAGFGVSNPNIGLLDLRSPLDVLFGDGEGEGDGDGVVVQFDPRREEGVVVV